MFDNEAMVEILNQMKNELCEQGLETEWYLLENFSGYSPVTGNSSDNVYCLEAYVGANPSDPTLSTYAIAQVFWDEYPSLSIAGIISLDANGEPKGKAYYSAEVDKNFSEIFLPLIYRGFNSLDSSGGLNGQVVQRYTNTKVMLQDFIPAMLFTMRLLVCCGLTGQLATITGDFTDLLTRIIAFIIGPFVKGEDIFIIPGQRKQSKILVPTRNRTSPTSAPYTMNSSTALDQCFTIALQYLTNS